MACNMSDAEHAEVAARLDPFMSTLWLALDWVRHHAPTGIYDQHLQWANRVAPLPGEARISSMEEPT